MNKEQQNLSWACLPKDERVRQRERYKYAKCEFEYGANSVRSALFGHHNLTSDTEPEELLYCSRDFVIGRYRHLTSSIAWNEGDERAFQAEISLLKELFGRDKCLPDKELNEDNFAKSEPSVQVEPKFKVGDKVRIIQGYGKGEVSEIISVD